MSQNHSVFALSIAATAAITALTFVTFAGATAAAAGNAAGVARTAGAIGDLVPVDILGTAQVTVGAAVTLGAHLEVDASGYGVPLAAGKAVAVALQAASAAGQVIEVALIPN